MTDTAPAATPATNSAPAAAPTAAPAASAPADNAANPVNNPSEKAASAPADQKPSDQAADAGKDGPAGEGAADNAEPKSDTADPAQGDGKSDTDADGQDPDQSSDGEGADDTDKDKSDEAKEVPQAQDYQQQLTLPEGMEIDKAAFDAIVPVLQEYGVPAEAMAKLGPIAGDMVSRAVKQMTDQHQAEVQGWYDQTVSEQGKGGETAFNERIATAQRAINAIFPKQETRDLICKRFGLGNHPDFVNAFYQIGLTISEDGSGMSPSAGGKQEETLADVWYPNAPK